MVQPAMAAGERTGMSESVQTSTVSRASQSSKRSPRDPFSAVAAAVSAANRWNCRRLRAGVAIACLYRRKVKLNSGANRKTAIAPPLRDDPSTNEDHECEDTASG